MRLLTALGVGLLMGIVFGIGFVYILVWNTRRLHPDLAGSVGVDLAPVLIAFVLGFGIGVVWMMRR